MKAELKIEGLKCGHCVNAVSTILNETDGVLNSSVALPDSAKIEFDEKKVSLDDIIKLINDSDIYKVV